MNNEDELILDKLCKVSPVSIEIIDLRTKQLVCTSGWTARHLGYTEDEFRELSGNLFEKLVHPDDRSIQVRAYQSLFEEQTVPFREFIIRVLRKDQTYDHIQIRITILECDASKKPCTVLCTAMDIGEVMELRERIDRQLRKLDIISYKNSHELRGPVATILGLINLIDHDECEGMHVRQLISSLKQTVIKLDGVIHEINEQSYD